MAFIDITIILFHNICCTNIYFISGIMVNGQFKCLGSIQHLKNRFGSGYSLTVRCLENNSENVQKTLEEWLPHAQLQEEHYTQMKYQLPVQFTKLPLVFRLDIVYYM